MRRNAPRAAADLYEAFHRFAPRRVGDFAKGFEIPATLHKQGAAVHVMYRSDKVDPATLRRPRKPVDYIHEHKPGVICAVADRPGKQIALPSFVVETDSLTLLGQCLGFAFQNGERTIEAVGKGKLPELYATPNGRALLVIQDKAKVLACCWGGKLTVEPRGIVG